MNAHRPQRSSSNRSGGRQASQSNRPSHTRYNQQTPLSPPGTRHWQPYTARSSCYQSGPVHRRTKIINHTGRPVSYRFLRKYNHGPSLDRHQRQALIFRAARSLSQLQIRLGSALLVHKTRCCTGNSSYFWDQRINLNLLSVFIHLLFSLIFLTHTSNKYVGPPYCRPETYAGRVACCPLPRCVTVSMPTGQTDRRTPDRYITLSVRRHQRDKKNWTQINYGISW